MSSLQTLLEVNPLLITTAYPWLRVCDTVHVSMLHSPAWGIMQIATQHAISIQTTVETYQNLFLIPLTQVPLLFNVLKQHHPEVYRILQTGYPELTTPAFFPASPKPSSPAGLDMTGGTAYGTRY